MFHDPVAASDGVWIVNDNWYFIILYESMKFLVKSGLCIDKKFYIHFMKTEKGINKCVGGESSRNFVRKLVSAEKLNISTPKSWFLSVTKLQYNAWALKYM